MRALVVVMLFLPLAAQDSGRVCAVADVIREWSGGKTGIAEEGYHVIRDSNAWATLWKQHRGTEPPHVDFDRTMALAVFPAEAVSVGWMRVTNVSKPGLSRFWVGLCPATKKIAFQIVVVPRTDLQVEFWFKDASLAPSPGKEPDRGGMAVDSKRVHGTEAVWSARVGKLSEDEGRQADRLMTMLESDDSMEREQATRGLLRLGARVRAKIEPLVASTDVEVRTRAKQIVEQLSTFDPTAAPTSREHALYQAREHLALKYSDQFSNDPEMRWEDDGVRSTDEGWQVKLKYL